MSRYKTEEQMNAFAFAMLIALILNIGFDKMEGKGFFTKEIETALFDKSVDLAVHSHKDLETTNPSGLIVACVSDRENPSELLIIRKESVDKKKKSAGKKKLMLWLAIDL